MIVVKEFLGMNDMTNIEAKEYLLNVSYMIGTTAVEYMTQKDGDKIREAIKVLWDQEWIPCNPLELPKDKKLWVTHDRWGCRYVDDVYWDMTEWSDDVSDVVAYMHYAEPEPYKEKT